MRTLVTGADGFVGRHLTTELQAHGQEVIPLLLPGTPPLPDALYADIRDARAVEHAVREARPDGCIHLAGMAFIPQAWDDPAMAFDVNVNGVIHILEALRAHASACRTVVVTSAEVYGSAATAAQPVREDEPCTPTSLYGVTKLAADQAARLYASRYDLPILTARPRNHIGPGQSDRFVAADFATQLLEIAAGRRPPSMHVGNLDSTRDFSDVRDVARAYRLLLQHGHPGMAYNIATGIQVPIRTLFDHLCRLTGAHPEVTVDPDRFRPTDASPEFDISRIRDHTGWSPQIPLEQTLSDLVEDLRRRG